MLAKFVEYFLASNPNWEVARINAKHNAEYVVRAVRQTRPDVVIIYEGNCPSQTQLPLRLMQDRPELKVILVSLENNVIEIYNKQQMRVKERDDLLAVIEG